MPEDGNPRKQKCDLNQQRQFTDGAPDTESAMSDSYRQHQDNAF